MEIATKRSGDIFFDCYTGKCPTHKLWVAGYKIQDFSVAQSMWHFVIHFLTIMV